MSAEITFNRLLDEFGRDVVLDKSGSNNDFAIYIKPEYMLDVIYYLKENNERQYNKLVCITGCDGSYLNKNKPVGPILFYHLESMAENETVVLTTKLPLNKPSIKSCADIWDSAEWYEREIREMIGVEFEDNPAPVNLLLPEDWKFGNPLRKNFNSPDDYNNIRLR